MDYFLPCQTFSNIERGNTDLGQVFRESCLKRHLPRLLRQKQHCTYLLLLLLVIYITYEYC